MHILSPAYWALIIYLIPSGIHYQPQGDSERSYVMVHSQCLHLHSFPANRFISIFSIFCSVQSLSQVRLFVTPWTAARQASLSITNSQSLLKLMPIELMMPSNHFSLCCPLLLLPSIFPNIRIFSNESALHIRWPKYWSFSFNISPSNEYSGLISFMMDWLDLLADQDYNPIYLNL